MSSANAGGAETAAKPPATQAEISARLRLIATVGVILALALTSIDLSAVATAMPRIAQQLSGLGLYSWVGVSYAVAASVVVPIAGKLGDMFGRKPLLLVGLVGFLCTSFVCGAATSMTELVIFRGLQGLFAGIQMANIFTVVADVFTPERRAQMQGLFFSVAGLSMLIGPPFGGFITDNWNWRWVFYVNVPLGIVSGLAVIVAVPYVRSSARWRDIDFLGAVTLVVGLVPILIGLSLIGDGRSWTSPAVLAAILGGAAFLIAFVLAEMKAARNPMVPMSLFKINQFSAMIVVAFFSAFAMMGTIFYVPLQLQGVLGASPGFAGSLLSPMMLALMVVPPVAGKALTSVRRYRFFGTAAFACMSGGLYLLSTVSTGSSRGITVIAMILVGIGIGIAFPMATSVVQSAVPMSQIGVATSQIQFWRMIAGPISLAVLGSILSSKIGASSVTASAPPAALAGGLHQLFLVDSIVVAVGLLATLFLKEVPLRPMPSMRGSKPKVQERQSA